MSYLPIMVDIAGLPCLVAGGGKIALHKAELFLSHGADVTVVAPEVCAEMDELPVTIKRRPVRAEDAEGRIIVADATGDPDAEAMLSEVCSKNNIPYICAGHGELCTAVLPAVYRKGRTVVAVSSEGASPAASARLRDMLKEHVPDRMDEILDKMSEIRMISRKVFGSQPVRRKYLHRCLDKMIEFGRPLSDKEELLIRQDINASKENILT